MKNLKQSITVLLISIMLISILISCKDDITPSNTGNTNPNPVVNPVESNMPKNLEEANKKFAEIAQAIQKDENYKKIKEAVMNILVSQYLIADVNKRKQVIKNLGQSSGTYESKYNGDGFKISIYDSYTVDQLGNVSMTLDSGKITITNATVAEKALNATVSIKFSQGTLTIESTDVNIQHGDDKILGNTKTGAIEINGFKTTTSEITDYNKIIQSFVL